MKCPICSDEMKEEEDNTLLYCTNAFCEMVAIQPYLRGDGIVKRDPSEEDE